MVGRPTGIKYLNQFLKAEQPEWQIETGKIDNQCSVAEAFAIFVVVIEQKYSQVRPSQQDLLHDERGSTGFSHTGAAEDCEMLVQHFVDVDASCDCRILVKIPNLDRS